MGVDWAGPVAAVTRRNVLRLFSAGVMANVLSGCRHDWPPAAACELPYPIVDVHCHFFNAADVPVEGLVRYVALREKLPEAKLSADPLQSKRLENALVVFLVTALGDVAPKAKAEDAILKKRVPRPSDAEFERQKDEQLRIAVKQLVALAGEQRASLTARSGAETPDYQGLLEQIGGTPACRRACSGAPAAWRRRMSMPWRRPPRPTNRSATTFPSCASCRTTAKTWRKPMPGSSRRNAGFP